MSARKLRDSLTNLRRATERLEVIESAIGALPQSEESDSLDDLINRILDDADRARFQ